MGLGETVRESQKLYERVRDIKQLHGTRIDSERNSSTMGDS